MRLLWLSNLAPSVVSSRLGKQSGSGLWMDHILQDLENRKEIELRILCPWGSGEAGVLSQNRSFATFPHERPETATEAQKAFFLRQLEEFHPDVVHIWGTEFGHTLSMLRACAEKNLLNRTVVGIQGLCRYVGLHYTEGLPLSVQRRYTLRDFLRRDNILGQQKTFLLRGENEVQALQMAHHVMGRTRWDRACAEQIHPGISYHFCGETLREPFYRDSWSYESCVKHRIFTSSRLYPIKGFHYVLEALGELLKTYPDAVLAVPGTSPCCAGKARLRQDSYARYLGELMERLHLKDHVEFLGSLSPEQMKEQFLRANVYVLPSTIENSSNSLGEAMLLGVPCAASYVGGTPSMLEDRAEGLLYQSTAPYMLAEAVKEIFSMEGAAEQMGARAAEHARKTHDAEKNLTDLLNIYRELSGEETEK